MSKNNNLNSTKRLTALEATGLVSSERNEALDRLTRLSSRLLKTQMAAVSLVDDKKAFLKSSKGLPESWGVQRSVPLCHSICKLAVTLGKPVIIYDTRHDWNTKENPILRELGIASYLGIPLKLSSGFIIGAFCVMDVNPRQWNQDDISTMKDLASSAITEIELKLLSTSRAEILAMVSHDLKNPLTSINLSSQMILRKMRSGNANAELTSTVRQILGAGKHMQLLIENVLDSAKIENGGVHLNRQWVNLHPLIAKAANIIRPMAQAKNLGFEMRCLCSDCRVFVDETQFLQVLVNLLGNAIKFSPEGKMILLEAITDSASSQISIFDEGPGIDEADLGHVFERYWQGKGVGKGGHGLGLHIVSKVVRAHGGTVSAFNRPSGGTAFEVSVPHVNSGLS